jgi:hypothetical protein
LTARLRAAVDWAHAMCPRSQDQTKLSMSAGNPREPVSHRSRFSDSFSTRAFTFRKFPRPCRRKPATNATSTNKDPCYPGNSDSDYTVLNSDWSDPETAGHGVEFIQAKLATEVLYRTKPLSCHPSYLLNGGADLWLQRAPIGNRRTCWTTVKC